MSHVTPADRRAAREAEQQAAIRRARQVGRDRTVRDGSDYGPGIRIARGEIVRELRPDIASKAKRKPDVRGARRRDSLRLLHAAGAITAAHWTAAEAFRNDLAIAGGARIQADPTGIRLPSVAPGMPSDRQIDALARSRGVLQATGLTMAGIVSWVIISGQSVRGYEQCKRLRNGRGKEMLLIALDRLADYYTSVQVTG